MSLDDEKEMLGLTWARLEAMLDAIDAATTLKGGERYEYATLSIFRESEGQWLALCYLGGRRMEGKGACAADAAARLRSAVLRELSARSGAYARALAKATGEGGSTP